MENNTRKKVVVITGASSGLGEPLRSTWLPKEGSWCMEQASRNDCDQWAIVNELLK